VEQPNLVSLWVGYFDTDKSLREATKTSYTEDGELINCMFADAFDIGRFNPSCAEIFRTEESASTLASLLTGISYEDAVISGIGNTDLPLREEINSAVLLYDFIYNKHLTRPFRGGWLRFVASTRYR